MPPSNFRRWGKDVGMWLVNNNREHPVLLSDLVKVQKAVAEDDVDAIPVSAKWLAQQKLDAEAKAKEDTDKTALEAQQKAHAEETKALEAQRKAFAEEQNVGMPTMPQDESSADEDAEAKDGQDSQPEATPEGEMEPVTKPRKRKK
jgi:hypothetical protein